MPRSEISSAQATDLLVLARRLNVEEYQERHPWLVRLTDPDFDMSTLNSVVRGLRWPKPGEVFELTLDADALGNQPFVMVHDDSYVNLDWRHDGRRLSGLQVGRFKFVQVGYQPNWAGVQNELLKFGKIPCGQWRQALKARFAFAPNCPVGVADASWVYPEGKTSFPIIRPDGSSGFIWTDNHEFNEEWFWLIETDEAVTVR